ncbi:hypothetical protein AAGW18_02265 [Vreelandella titanicae]|uniref:hypothetical protein n=1 Tax=Vreelandella titanicae TaxID=664683 RepID=UPI00241E11D9|nr:hypothetical protein [Halomonas titanicae]
MITLSLPGVSLPVKAKDYKNLEDAYDKYLFDPKHRPSQFGLETAYWRCYKKRASAKLIDDLAQVSWGPMNAWEVFGKSSPALIQWNHANHSVKEKWGFKHPKIWKAFSVFSTPILFFASAFLLYAGFFAVAEVVVLWVEASLSDFHDSKEILLFATFIFGTLGPALIGIGAGGIYTSVITTKSASLESHVQELKSLVDEYQAT